jgi:branched-chain amino acid transport system substrate-binding protein
MTDKNLFKSISLLLLFAVLVFTGCHKDQEPILKIGVFEPITGSEGPEGKQETLGILYANSLTPKIKIGDTDYKIQLEVADNESSIFKAKTAATNLVEEQVSIVLGSYGSEFCIAGSRIFENANIPAIGITCTNPLVTLRNSHYFRICFLDPFQGTVLAHFAIEQFNAKRAYCLAKLNDDYSVGLCNYFIEAFKKNGNEFVFETFPEGTTDFSAYITNAKKHKADVFFCPLLADSAQFIVELAGKIYPEVPILAGDAWDSNIVTSVAKDTGMEIYVTSFFCVGCYEDQISDFISGFKNYINTNSNAKINNGGDDEISASAAMGFDAYYVALEALKLAQSTESSKVLEALPKIKYDGITGNIEFDKNGDAIRDTAFVKKFNHETGKWTFVSKQKVNQ